MGAKSGIALSGTSHTGTREHIRIYSGLGVQLCSGLTKVVCRSLRRRLAIAESIGGDL